MPRRESWAIVVLVGLVLGCDPEPDEHGGEEATLSPSAVPWSTTTAHVAADPISLGDSLAIFHPSNMQWVGDSVVVTEPGTGRVLFLDARQASGRTIGRRGRGPGEFRAPWSAEGAWPFVAISDHRNARATILDLRSGTVEWEVALPAPLLSGGVVAGPGASLLRLGSPGSDSAIVVQSRSGILQRLVGKSPGAENGDIPIRFERLLASNSGPIFVERHGTISWYDWNGVELDRLTLPPAVLRAAEAEITRYQELMGEAFVGASYLSTATALPDGRIAARIPGKPDSIIGLIADPSERSVQILIMDDGLIGDAREWLSGAVATSPIDGGLLVLHQFGFATYRIDP